MFMSTHHIAAIVASFTLVACADDRHADEPSLGEDACEHFAEGPVRTATAGVSSDAATDVSGEHLRWDLTLVESPDDARGGFVSVAIDAAGEHVFFFDGAVEVVVTDAAGAVVTPEGVVTSDPDCATVAAALTFDLAVGTYTLALSAVADELSLVYFEAAHDDDHEH